jgi:type I restriction enzyme S subunit
LVTPGQFILSKIDARNGAFGIVPDELQGAIVTNDFPLYDVDNSKILTEYLHLISATKQFQKFCKSASSGTTGRQRVDEALFLKIEVPLPSLTEQTKLVEQYYNDIAKATQGEKETTQSEKAIETYLLEHLGITIRNAQAKKGLQFVRFKEIERWDTLFLLGSTKVTFTFPEVAIGSLFKSFMLDDLNKSVRFESFKSPEKEFIYLGMENVQKETGELLDCPVIKGKTLKSQTLKVPKDFFIYGKLRPYLNKYWINETVNDNIICSSEFFVFSIDNTKVNKQYFKTVLGSQLIQRQIAEHMSGARMPRISEDIFINLKIPLPPSHLQAEIVKHVVEQRAKHIELKRKAENLRLSAKENFEATLFEA